MLAVLLERPGEVVTRDELRRRLWDGDTFVDYESGLNTAANRLRLKLGDSAESPRYVETVARTGYRFIAPVEKVEAEPPAPETIVRAEVPAVLPPVRQRKRPSRLAVAAMAMVIAAAAAAYFLTRFLPRPSTAGREGFQQLTF